MIQKVHEAFINDSMINSMTNGRIKFYTYPESGDVTGPYIIIDPLITPKPGDYADNKWLTKEYLYQIEVWSKSKDDTESLAEQIQLVLWNKIGYANTGSGMDEYDKELGIFRDARRYRGKEYVNQ
ncbi:hypothetical protein LS684_21080 (plasmid) [Cytobacillus spongiae]|uniref:hypothetical protein n=1 Tax=Cytobacillus spongiae TaxID=2901381 RepID=UPI001F48156B|nr:hypothetical protein [Cytobacillus spongiae]UII58118.1 hypothetical protein LS684_21080 [Cytobacillus spongiae]